MRELEDMMLKVIDEVQVKQYQVEDIWGKWITLRLTPYRTLDNFIGGGVLTVVDRSAFGEPIRPDSGRSSKSNQEK